MVLRGHYEFGYPAPNKRVDSAFLKAFFGQIGAFFLIVSGFGIVHGIVEP